MAALAVSFSGGSASKLRVGALFRIKATFGGFFEVELVCVDHRHPLAVSSVEKWVTGLQRNGNRLLLSKDMVKAWVGSTTEYAEICDNVFSEWRSIRLCKRASVYDDRKFKNRLSDILEILDYLFDPIHRIIRKPKLETGAQYVTFPSTVSPVTYRRLSNLPLIDQRDRCHLLAILNRITALEKGSIITVSDTSHTQIEARPINLFESEMSTSVKMKMPTSGYIIPILDFDDLMEDVGGNSEMLLKCTQAHHERTLKMKLLIQDINRANRTSNEVKFSLAEIRKISDGQIR